MRSELLVPVAVVIANVSGVAVSLVAPAFLPPAEYSSFALAWAVGQFLAMLCFEWLRFPALRFSTGKDAELAAARGGVIAATYRRVAIGMVVLIAASLAFARMPGVFGIVPFALIYAVCQGTFDGRQAFARAARRNLAFARNWAMRAMLSIAAVCAVAWATRAGWAAAVALSLSFPLALAIGAALDGRAADAPARPLATRWAELPRLARYGVLAAVSGVVAYAVPTVVRWALFAHGGEAGAAGALLAADLSQKALAVTGLAVNVVAMQNSFSAVDSGDAEAIRQTNRRQIAWACAAVLPVGLLVWLMGGDVADVLMRPAYRDAFTAAIGPCALAGGLICVRMFAVDPLFYAFERAGLAVAGAATSLAACLLGLWLPAAARAIDPLTVFWGSAAAGLAVSTALALGVLRIRLPWSQLARIALAGGAVMAADRLLRMAGLGLDGIVALAAIGAVLGLTYAVAAVALDVAGLRSEVLPRLRRRRG